MRWALLSALYPDDSHHKNEISRYRTHADKLNLEGIVDFPTPISQIPQVEKHFNLAINVYGYTTTKKKETITIFTYYISEQSKGNAKN